MYRKHNENPRDRNVGDCTVRAISTATGENWDTVHMILSALGRAMGDMPSANEVWGLYLKAMGWERRFLPRDCPVCYTVKDFCREYPRGTYVLGLDGHVVCVIDGDFYDTWDSSGKRPLFYWTKEDRR